jgi:Ca2+-binding RTX toxin-like protein
LRVLGLASGLVLLALPAAASASTVSTGAGELKVTDPANIAQATTVAFDAATGDYLVDDGGGPTMVAVAPCVANPAATAVQCPGAGITEITIDGAGGIDDLFIDATVPTAITTFLGGGTGPDVLNGGGTNDTMDGGDGSDIFNGGAGKDTVSYASRSGPAGVRVRFGAGPVSGNGVDGPAGGRDTVRPDVENAVGSPQVDYLFGNGAANRLDGGDTRDKITGKGGNDTVLGRGGDDVLRGGPGADHLVGGPDRDNLDAQGGGGDVIDAVDNFADALIDCGPGAGEIANVDAIDPAPVNC